MKMSKKIKDYLIGFFLPVLAAALLFIVLMIPKWATAQSYPSPTFSTLSLLNPLTVANGGTGVATSTGSGSVVLSTSPTLVTPNLGTPSAVTLTHGTGLPLSTGITGFGTGVATGLANAATGSGSPVFGTSPTISSATLTGSPTAPTPTTGVNSTAVATAAYVASEQPCASMIDHGGDPTGTNDNTAALTATLAANPSGQLCAYFPPGIWKFTSQQTINLTSANNSVTLKGAGIDTTVLTFPNAAGGIQINYSLMTNSAHVRNLTFATGQTGATTGLILTNTNAIANRNYQNAAPNDVTNVAFRGADGYAVTDYWSVGILVNTVSSISFNAVSMTGSGAGTAGTGLLVSGYNVSGVTNAATSSSSNVLSFASTPAGVQNGMFIFDLTNPAALLGSDQTYVSSFTGTTVTMNVNAQGSGVASGDTIIFENAGVMYNVTNSVFNNLNIGVEVAQGAQGVTVGTSNFTGGNYGIYTPTGQFGLTELAVNGGNQFNQTLNQITTLSAIADTVVTGNLFYVRDNTATYPGINLGQSARFVIASNDFVDSHSGGSAPTAISIGNTNSQGGFIGPNSINGFGTGVALTASSANVIVYPQSYFNNTTTFTNSGTSNTYGVPGNVIGAQAAAGAVGQIQSSQTSGTSLTTGVAANAASETLAAGNWDVQCTAQFGPAGTTVTTGVIVGINTTSATLPGFTALTQLNGTLGTGQNQIITSPPVQELLSASTTVYCPVQASFTTSTMTVNGNIRARRMQ